MITIYHMQIQNNYGSLFCQGSLCQRAYNYIKKNVQIWKKDSNFYGIFNYFGLTLLFKFFCSSVYFILAELRPGIFFL